MKTKAIAITIYALLVLAGGITGYIVAGSLVSILVSGLFAGLLLICSFLIAKGNSQAYIAALGVLAFLFIFFSYRFILSSKMMPGGMMAILTALTAGYLLFSNKKLQS